VPVVARAKDEQSVIEAEASFDYRAMLERVIGRLPDPTDEARQAIYHRVRVTLVSHLRSGETPTSEERIEREIDELEAAIGQVEAGVRAPGAVATNVAPPSSTIYPAERFAGSSSQGRQAPPPDSSPPLSGRSHSVARPARNGWKSAARDVAFAAGFHRRALDAPVSIAAKPREDSPSGDQRPTHGQGANAVRRRGSAQAAVESRSNRIDPTLAVILEFQHPSAAIVNAPIPRSARGVAWVITSMVVALIAAAGFISVDQVVTARGIVVSQSPTILVQPLETSIVRSIEVSEGKQVRAGDVLAKLDPTFAAADLGALTAQISSLSAEVARLQSEAAGKPFVYTGDEPDWLLQASIYGHRQAEFRLKMENYKDKIDELASVVARAKSDSAGYSSRADVAASVEQIRKELEARELGSHLNTLAASDARAEMDRALANAEETIQTAGRDLAALQAERDSFSQDWSADVDQKLADANRKLSDAREQMNKAQLRRTLVELRADKDAIVQSLAKVSVGSVLQSGQPFITLIPVDASLEVEANIAASENGFVHVGDPVAIKFDTLPYTQYGMAAGGVRIVSPNSFTSQEEERNPTSALPLQPSTQPFYRARVSIDRIALHGTPAGFRLIPGMPVTADIKVGRRTVLDYFLGRVLPVTREGMREP
jgi:HlyD family secretion protein